MADGSVTKALGAGVLAGLIGTLAMSVLMLTAQRFGLLGEQPPRKLSDALLDRIAGGSVDEETRRLGTALVHLGIGSTAAGIHQVCRHLLGRPRPAALWGGLFGAGFWAMNYGVIAPAMGIMPPPDRDRLGRAPVMLAANILWGAVSAEVGDRLTRPVDADQPARRKRKAR